MKYLAVFLAIIFIMVLAVKQNNMTIRQSVLKAIYPALMSVGKFFGTNDRIKTNTNNIKPPGSFYGLSAIANNGEIFSFDSLEGKKVMLVNTASDCGYTGQYDELEKLYQQYKGKLVIIAFPANDFKDQEAASDDAIATFCKLNYGITFPLMKKSVVIKRFDQNSVFQWLSDKSKNGWNDKEPTWNFSKYLVDGHGKLVSYFDPSISPLSKDVIDAINR